MKKIVYAIMLLLAITASAYAVPQYINYQGILRDITGNNLQNGTFTMDFKIYNTATSGSAIFDSLPIQVNVSNGLYNVSLGAVNSTIFDGSDLWLEVTVGSDTLSPRLKINSVAYALRADVAGTAASANYATLSGTASSAAHAVNADTVNNIAANTSPTANAIYPLDSSGKLSGIPISATASGTNNALLINGGKIGISPRGDESSSDINANSGNGNPSPTVPSGIAGTAFIPKISNTVTINNQAVTSTSIILLTPVSDSTLPSALMVLTDTTGGKFIVQSTSGGNFLNGCKFNYLIIN